MCASSRFDTDFLHAGTWTTTDAVLSPALPGPPLDPQLVPRYPARKGIKDKEWPKYIERAVKAVYDNKKLRGYDVLPPDLRDQYDVIGWLQVCYSTYQAKPFNNI